MADSNSNSREILASFLANSDARCPSCRYALRGCMSDKCPECGCELGLAVVGAGPSTSTWWFAAIAGCGVAALITLLLLVALLDNVAGVLRNPWLPQNVRSGFTSVSELPQWSRIFIVVALNAFIGLLMAWVIARRHAFSQWSRPHRTWVGLVCWLSPAIVLAFIAWLTR